jgi:NAD(P)-dependent dehydrogenase (short-subunit alcohol dehydrogenase family)
MDILDQFSLQGRTAIVTGACYGLGISFARVLAQAGANVVLAARSVDKLRETAAMVQSSGVKAMVTECDVTIPDSVSQMVSEAWDTFGRADVLVNNAGVAAEIGIMPERIPDEVFAMTMPRTSTDCSPAVERSPRASWPTDAAAQSSTLRRSPGWPPSHTSPPRTRHRRRQ